MPVGAGKRDRTRAAREPGWSGGQGRQRLTDGTGAKDGNLPFLEDIARHGVETGSGGSGGGGGGGRRGEEEGLVRGGGNNRAQTVATDG